MQCKESILANTEELPQGLRIFWMMMDVKKKKKRKCSGGGNLGRV